jgi:hypothetical protein
MDQGTFSMTSFPLFLVAHSLESTIFCPQNCLFNLITSDSMFAGNSSVCGVAEIIRNENY